MKKLFLIILISGIVFSCNDRLEEMNKPKKNASEVPGEFLFTNGVREMFDLMASTDVNTNIFRLFSQYWAQTTYPDESQYNLVGREIADNFWTVAYRDALSDLDQAGVVIKANYEKLGTPVEQKDNQIAIINTCKVYMYSVLVDAFGAIPYTEALNEDILSPKYDAGKDVYYSLIDTLNAAIASMNVEAAGFRASQDPVYQGQVAGWKKFANSLKLRLAVNISDVDPAKAQTMITEAIAGGIISSNADNASITYLATSPNTNPVWEDLVQSGRTDYVIANTLADRLISLNDPRLPVYAQPMGDGTFKGGTYGSGNVYGENSPAGTVFHNPDLEGVILDYAEVNFLLAEAAAKNLTVPGTIETYYNAGIRASMEYWGVAEAAITQYLANPKVAYATAEGDWKQKIGIQEWIAFYNRGFEGWTAWRRLDFAGFNVPQGLTAEDIPKRLTFPIQEAQLNPVNYKEGASLVGGDNVQTKVFWDVK